MLGVVVRELPAAPLLLGEGTLVRTLMGVKGSPPPLLLRLRGSLLGPPPGWLFCRHFFRDLWLIGVVLEHGGSPSPSPKAESLSLSPRDEAKYERLDSEIRTKRNWVTGRLMWW